MNQDIFGATRMGYVVIESAHLDRWTAFLEEGIGLHKQHVDSNLIAFRMDEFQRRVMVTHGPAEDIAAVGWQLENKQVLETVLKRMQKHGIQCQASTPEQAAARGVKEYWSFLGPKRMVIELFVEPLLSDEPLNMLCSGFVTGEAGMGHMAITTRRAKDMRRFWEGIFDARYSDTIVEKMGSAVVDIEFFRVNPRHHSVAIAQVRDLQMDPVRTKVQHINLLTRNIEDLTEAFLRCRRLGFEMAHEIGEHPNDREQSFYVMSPSGFEVEVGWNALEVDEATWEPTTYRGISLWGHKPEKRGRWHKLTTQTRAITQGLRSKRIPEYSPLEGE